MKKSSRTRFLVKGLNQERTLNQIIKKIKVYNFKRLQHDLSEFEVDYKHRKLIAKLLSESGFIVQEEKHFGFLNFLKSTLSRYGLVSAIIIIVLLYCFQYNFVLKIDVVGAGNDNVRLANFVKKNLTSRYKKNIDTEKLEILVKDNFEDVSSVSAAIIGQTLIININKAVISDEMKEGKEIVSKFDGIITQINLIQGTLAVNEGDIVKKGDILVYPYVIDSQGEQREVTARAEIYADVWHSASEIYYDYYITTKRTGRKVVNTEIYLSSLLLYSNAKQLIFKQYDVEESWTTVSKNNFLPIMRKQCICYETVTKEVKQDFEQDKSKIIEKARAKALIFLEKNEIIKEENFIIRDAGSVHEVEYYLTVNRNIGG